MEKVAIYCRLSVEDQKEGESESIGNQRMLLEDYAKRQGWAIFGVYTDDDYSGLRDDRPAFTQMLQDAKEGQFSIILCKTQSRFTRSIQTAERYLHEAFPQWGIRFIGLVDGVDTSRKENKKARQINSLVNEWYCEELSENIRAVLRRKMEEGQFLGNFAPYGYRKDPNDRHHLVVDVEESAVVQEIARWYLEGLSCRLIAVRLTELGVCTPSQRKHARGEDMGRKTPSAWGGSTVGKILKNPVYLGHMVQGKERKASYRGKKTIPVPPEQWVVVKNTHEAVIEYDVFCRLQEAMVTRQRGGKSN